VLKGDARLLAPDETPEVEEMERRRQEALDRVRATLKAGATGEGAGGGGGGEGKGGREGAAERVERERAERRAREGTGGGDSKGKSGGDSGSSGSSSSDEEEERRDGGGGKGRGGGRGSAAEAVAERRAFIEEKRAETLQKGIGRWGAPGAFVCALCVRESTKVNLCAGMDACPLRRVVAEHA
jgi:hypothetical protein